MVAVPKHIICIVSSFNFFVIIVIIFFIQCGQYIIKIYNLLYIITSKNKSRFGKCAIPITILYKKNCNVNDINPNTSNINSFVHKPTKMNSKKRIRKPKYISPLYTDLGHLISTKEEGAKKYTYLTHNIYDARADRYICMYATTPKEQQKLYKTIITKIGIENVCINQIPKNANYRLFFDLDFNKGSLTSAQRKRVVEIYHEQAELICGCKLNLLIDENKGNFHGRFNLKLAPHIYFLMPNDIETKTLYSSKMDEHYKSGNTDVVKVPDNIFRSVLIEHVIKVCIHEFPDIPVEEWNKQIDDAYGIRTPLCSKAESKSKYVLFNKRSYYRNDEIYRKSNLSIKKLAKKLVKYDICNVENCFEPILNNDIIHELLAKITKHTQNKAEPTDYRGCQIGEQVNIGDEFTPINYIYTIDSVKKIVSSLNPSIITRKKAKWPDNLLSATLVS